MSASEHFTAESDALAEVPWPRRFSWPMRLFLLLFVFDMIARGFLTLTSYEKWYDELAMETTPTALPTRAKIANLYRGEKDAKSAGLLAVAQRFGTCLASAGRYFVPWPEDKTQAKLDSAERFGKYAVAWTGSRCGFVARLVGIDHGWPMYSPNVATEDTVGRCILVYADGSQTVLRNWADPEDQTHFWRFGAKRPLQIGTRMHEDYTARDGYCNWVAHEYATNDRGAALVRIDVFKVTFEFVGPEDDPVAFLAAQSGPPAKQIEPVFYTYDVAARKGHTVAAKK
jgi:hypothetical protein